jgi:Protein of unknown function (DUF2630)
MDDSTILGHIGHLVDEEHHLRQRHGTKGLEPDDLARLEAIEVELDQCWDLLDRRRAVRSAGEDPTSVEVRDATTVEGYQQ